MFTFFLNLGHLFAVVTFSVVVVFDRVVRSELATADDQLQLGRPALARDQLQLQLAGPVFKFIRSIHRGEGGGAAGPWLSSAPATLPLTLYRARQPCQPPGPAQPPAYYYFKTA